MSLIEKIHGSYVHKRRSGVLARHIAGWLPANARVLDMGCGDGLVAWLVAQQRPDIEIRGIDVMVRNECRIPVDSFDGQNLPGPDDSFDAVLFIDVLHHTDDAMGLLREARRVARKCIIIKDHNCSGLLARPILKFMDYTSNARHGIALPCNYWPDTKWRHTFDQLSLKIVEWRTRIGMYPPPASWVFERSLHFITRLDVCK